MLKERFQHFPVYSTDLAGQWVQNMSHSPCSSANSLKSSLQGTFSASDSITEMLAVFHFFTCSRCLNFPTTTLPHSSLFQHDTSPSTYSSSRFGEQDSFWVLIRGWWAQLQNYKPTSGLEQVPEWQIQSHEPAWHKRLVSISSAIPMTSYIHAMSTTLWSLGSD